MMSTSTLPSRFWMTPILSLTLAPPRMATKWALGILQRAAQILQLFFHEQTQRRISARTW